MFDLYSGRWTACAERDEKGQRDRKEVDEEKGTYQFFSVFYRRWLYKCLSRCSPNKNMQYFK